MPWTDFYPILNESQIADYESIATADEQTKLDGWCAVARKANPRESVHLVTVSLFWKHLTAEESEFLVTDRQQMMDAVVLGLISR